MDELVFDIDKAAIAHYKHRMQNIIGKKENIELKPILEKQLQKMFELLDEIYKCFDEKNDEQRKSQWDRNVYVLCKALLMYKEDLGKSKEIMSNFGTEKTSLNTREIENHIERVDGRIGTLRVTIGELEAFPNMATF